MPRKPLPAGPGRPRGVPNKMTAELKDMILGALREQPGGGQEYLSRQAKKRNPAGFLKLVGQCLPKDIKLTNDLEMHINLIGVERRG